jgi:hypothetical protein
LANHEVESILREVDMPRFSGSRLSEFFMNRGSLRPMTSLRDVDEPGLIVASDREANERARIPDGALERTMRFIRRGSGSDVDDAQGDEDDE